MQEQSSISGQDSAADSTCLTLFTGIQDFSQGIFSRQL